MDKDSFTHTPPVETFEADVASVNGFEQLSEDDKAFLSVFRDEAKGGQDVPVVDYIRPYVEQNPGVELRLIKNPRDLIEAVDSDPRSRDKYLAGIFEPADALEVMLTAWKDTENLDIPLAERQAYVRAFLKGAQIQKAEDLRRLTVVTDPDVVELGQNADSAVAEALPDIAS